jgi:hypothetical protein
VRWLLAGAGLGVLFFVSCGSSSEGQITPTGGELCDVERRICLEIPAQGISETQNFRLTAPSADRPGGQVSEVWDIEAVDKEEFRFLKPAIVRIKLTAIDMSNVADEGLLRVGSSRDGQWEDLGDVFLDRVRGEIRGTTLLLRTKVLKRAVSAFAVLRSDRLPDGGVPMETDAGPRPDSGVIIMPPVPDAGRRDAGVDAGTPDAGQPVDAGTPDAGRPDAGTVTDAGAGTDAGAAVDAGVDAGMIVDAGVDAGMAIDAGIDAGAPVDAGVDAGQPVDAGVDAGSMVDAGVDAGAAMDAGVDAGVTDAGAADAGDAG